MKLKQPEAVFAASRLRSPEEGFVTSMGRVLQESRPTECTGYVAMQLGASRDFRRWPVGYFAQVADFLWEQSRLCPVLLGSKQEQHLTEKMLTRCNAPAISLCGKTSLEELAGALTHMKLLITNDTGTMHLAAGLSVPIIGIFLATAQPFDTGPYTDIACLLEPDLPCHPCPFSQPCPFSYKCRPHILPEVVENLVAYFSHHGNWDGVHVSGARAWRPYIDDNGFYGLHCLSDHGASDRTVWMEAQRHFMCQFLDRNPKKPFVLQLPSRYSLSLEVSSAIRAELAILASRLELLLQQIRLLQMKSNPALLDKLAAGWQEVLTSLQQSAWLGVLSFIWASEAQLDGQSLIEFTKFLGDFQALLQGIHDVIR